MSEDKRKHARTQGRFSGGDKEYSSRRQDKQSTKLPPTDKNKGEKRKAPVVGSRVESEIDLQYEEDSKYSFKELEPAKKPQEIKFIEPIKELSKTDYGISRLIYDPDFMKIAEANEYFNILESTTLWYDKNILIRGVEYPQPRLVAWYGPHPYTYAGATLEAREMPNAVREIKEKVEAALRKHNIKVELNSVLLNLYRNEKDSVAWHSDDELSLGICPTIASVSLGETRRFEMRPKENIKDMDARDIIYVQLTHGSLIVMDGVMQKDWLHRIPKEFHDKGARINLTFRTIYSLDQLPPEMPRVSNMKSAKSPSEKVMQQQDPKFDAESFPPLGMEAREKKTKLVPKENGSKDYQQPPFQRKSPKESRGANDKKTKPSSKSYQKSVNQRKSQEKKEENWDDDMFQSVEDKPTIGSSLNERSSHDSMNGSSELHSSQFDFNSNVKGSTKLNDKQFPSSDFRKSESYSNDSETYQPHSYEAVDSYLRESKDPSPSENKPVEIEGEAVDFNSNIEESGKLCDKQFFPSSPINSEYQSGSLEAQYDYEPYDNHLQKLKGANSFENKPVEIIEEPIEIDAKMSESGKKYTLNANAPVFLPQKVFPFKNYSLSELLEAYPQLKKEELHSFKDEILDRLYAPSNSLLSNRDFIELDVYDKLTRDDSLNNDHLKIILERICSMVKHAFLRQMDPRNTNRYPNRSFTDNNHYKHKQSYGRSPRY